MGSVKAKIAQVEGAPHLKDLVIFSVGNETVGEVGDDSTFISLYKEDSSISAVLLSLGHEKFFDLIIFSLSRIGRLSHVKSLCQAVERFRPVSIVCFAFLFFKSVHIACPPLV